MFVDASLQVPGLKGQLCAKPAKSGGLLVHLETSKECAAVATRGSLDSENGCHLNGLSKCSILRCLPEFWISITENSPALCISDMWSFA
jgi:hypothetical protein